VMNTGLAHLDTFGELYVYSSGYFPDRVAAFEESFKAVLDDPKTNEELFLPVGSLCADLEDLRGNR